MNLVEICKIAFWLVGIAEIFYIIQATGSSRSVKKLYLNVTVFSLCPYVKCTTKKDRKSVSN